MARLMALMRFRHGSRLKRRRARAVGKKFLAFSFAFLAVVLCTASVSSFWANPSPPSVSFPRSLASAGTCADESEYNQVLAIPALLGILYCFLALAIICDEYFEPCLQQISDRLKLSEDVAGATFMAAGSSAPELFTSMVDAFVTKNSIGIGTIVGSAMFNILVIVAMSAAVTRGSVKIDWRPVVRDVSFYLGAIGALTFVILLGGNCLETSNDGVCTKRSVLWYEGLFMVFMYFGYILFMYFNSAIFEKCAPLKDIRVHDVSAESQGSKNQVEGGDDDDDDDECWYKPPDSLVGKIYWVISMPLVLLFKATVPNVEEGMFKNWMVLGFTMSVLWIGVACFVMVYLATEIGCMLGVNPIVMGVVLLAGGTSVPDMIASMIVARQGQADMAIANAVGSNVFDILLGLGLPWFLAPLLITIELNGKPVEDNANVVGVEGLVENVAILVSTVIFYLGVIIVNRWQMNRKIGVVFTLFYIIYVTYSVVTALNADSK